METVEKKSIEILNDLLQINNDRIAGFEHAIKELDNSDMDLRALFEKGRMESQQYVQELTQAITQIGGEPDISHSVSGTIHRNWLDIKATFTGHNRKSILEECERGEDAIKKAYQDALANNQGLSPNLTNILARQQQTIIQSHDGIRALRNNLS